MAEPAQQWGGVEDTPGNKDHPASKQPNLQVLEGGSETSAPTGNLHSVPDTSESLSNQEQLAGPSYQDRVGRGYKASKKNKLSFLSNNRKPWLIGGGVFGAILIAALVTLFSFLNAFKLDGIMSNIDQRAFVRFNAATDRRSDKWIQSYFLLRLTQLKGDGVDPDSEYFRANSVDTNNPARDWYKTLKASRFEADLAKRGIVFANRPSGNGFTFSVLKVNENQIAGLTAKDVRKGDLVNRLRSDPSFKKSLRDEVDMTKPGANREARRILKQTINELAASESVIKRRQVRKYIQNMAGVRDWRFFETTRDKVDNKKIEIRNKIIVKMVPETTLSGKFVRCLFGITDCTFNRDPSALENRAGSALAGEGNPDKVTDPVTVTETDDKGNIKYDKQGKPISSSQTINLKDSADFLKRLIGNIGKALNAANLLATLDAFSKLNDAIKNGELSKGVAIARGVQAMALYQVFETSRDQIKTGEVTGAEVNQFMNVIGPVANSEAWVKVVNGNGDSSKLTQTSNKDPKNLGSKEYCDAKHQEQLQYRTAQSNNEFAYLCPDKQIGGGSNAASLEGAYNDSVGKFIGPVVTGWQKVRKAPILGTLLNLFENFSKYFSKILANIVDNILKVAAVRDNVYAAVQWMAKRTLAFLGAGPIMTGNEGAGQYMNWLVQGGAYTAEASARASGASLTTAQSRQNSTISVASYQSSKAAGQSTFERYFSLSNPDSPVAKNTLALSQHNLSSLGSSLLNFGSIFKTLSSAIALPFSHRTFAATDYSYKAANFSGIATYDFPPQCYDLDPLTATPQSGTNIQNVLGNKVVASDLTWDLVTNSEQWYQYVYSKIADAKNAEQLAEQIYNCSLLDNVVRGGLAYAYGYTKDSGLNDSGAGGGQTDPSSGIPVTAGSQIVGNIGDNSDNVACAPGTKDLGIVQTRYTGAYKNSAGPLMIRLCQVPSITGYGDGPNGATVSGGATVNSRTSGAWLALGQAAKNAKIPLSSSSSFRLEDSCGGTGTGTACATPGSSLHQMGIAIDFAGMTTKGSSTTSCAGRAKEPGNPTWLWLYKNAESFGFKQYTYESWHWDPLPAANRCGFGQ